MFMEALFIVAKTGKQYKCPLIEELRNIYDGVLASKKEFDNNMGELCGHCAKRAVWFYLHEVEKGVKILETK